MRTVNSLMSLSSVISYQLTRSLRSLLADVVPPLWAAFVAVALMRGSLVSVRDYLLAASGLVMLVIMWARSSQARRNSTRDTSSR